MNIKAIAFGLMLLVLVGGCSNVNVGSGNCGVDTVHGEANFGNGNCGSGKIGFGTLKTVNRAVPPFSKVNASGALTVHLNKGAHMVKVTADDNLISSVSSVVNSGSGTLNIYTGTMTTSSRIEVWVTAPHFNGVQASGAVEILTVREYGGALLHTVFSYCYTYTDYSPLSCRIGSRRLSVYKFFVAA